MRVATAVLNTLLCATVHAGDNANDVPLLVYEEDIAQPKSSAAKCDIVDLVSRFVQRWTGL